MDNENIYDAAYSEAHIVEEGEVKTTLKNNIKKNSKKREEMETDLLNILQ